MPELYADIVVPLAQDTFTFRVGEALRGTIAPGGCVKVQLGPSKLYTGIVWRVHKDAPPFRTIKTVDAPVDNAPVLSATQMRFWQWMAEYYMCSLGEVMRAALPSSLKPSGFSNDEFARETYRPPVVTYVALDGRIDSEEKLNEAFEKLKRARRQYDALVELADLAGDGLFADAVPRRLLKADAAVLKALAKKGVITITETELKPGELPPLPTVLPKLTQAQRSAADAIGRQFAEKEVVLMKGVTGSGKTEIYINLIDGCLREGKNVLYLLPEIAMTSQLVERIEGYFGSRVVAYHSGFSERSRVESYRRVNSAGGGTLVLGVRSALFLPVENLGLVIVDEEHDASYKQGDPAPRYNARDSAIVLARMSGAKTLLGSATPSLESYANATGGKYGLVTLDERYGGAVLPRIILSDTLRAVKRGERSAHFNKLLLDKIDGALAAGEQVMLFQNRRGFSPYVECGECGWTASCPNCSVTLTLHKADGKLRCHYCGHSKNTPTVCPSCGLPAVEPRGFGTEKVEEELARLFPEANVARLDRDSSKSAKSYNGIISAFEQGKTDILVGTQMITKGFDFGGVSLVGILNADNLLAYPDFRASERAFQLMVQVAGRAGRRQKRGEVVIQTSQPSHPLIQQVASGDYEAMARGQLAERSAFFYPPYCRIVLVTLKHRDKLLLWRAANRLGDMARPVFGRRLLGPQPPAVDRVKREYLLAFMLKIERDKSFVQAKKLLAESIAALHAEHEFRYVTVSCNVDPQ